MTNLSWIFQEGYYICINNICLCCCVNPVLAEIRHLLTSHGLVLLLTGQTDRRRVLMLKVQHVPLVFRHATQPQGDGYHCFTSGQVPTMRPQQAVYLVHPNEVCTVCREACGSYLQNNHQQQEQGLKGHTSHTQHTLLQLTFSSSICVLTHSCV